jgi:hypothetical protein
MARRSGTEKLTKTIVSVTSTCPTKTDLAAPVVGAVYSPRQLVCTNMGTGGVGLNICEGDTPLLPTVVIAGSGTFVWTPSELGDLELAIGSGLTACLTVPGTVDIASYFVQYDESAGITKEAARNATYVPSNATAIRTPNHFGGQAKN